MERPLQARRDRPRERVYKTAEIKKLKAENEKDENAPPIIRKVWPTGAEARPPLQGRVDHDSERETGGRGIRASTLTCGTRSRCRCCTQVGLRRSSRRRSCPTRSDAWYNPEAVRVGYEINFNRHFYKPQPMRSLEEIRADILALERETEGLLEGILAR